MQTRPTDEQIQERASEDLQDAVHNESLIEHLAAGRMSMAAFVERLEYLQSKHSLENAEIRIQGERDDSFEVDGS